MGLLVRRAWRAGYASFGQLALVWREARVGSLAMLHVEVVDQPDQGGLLVGLLDLGEAVRAVAVALHGVRAARVAPEAEEDEEELACSADAERAPLGGAAEVGSALRQVAAQVLEALDLGERDILGQVVDVPLVR